MEIRKELRLVGEISEKLNEKDLDAEVRYDHLTGEPHIMLTKKHASYLSNITMTFEEVEKLCELVKRLQNA